MEDQLAREVPVVRAVIGEALHQLQGGQAVSRGHRARGGQEQLAVHEAEERGDVLVAHRAAAEGEDLVEEAERVARAALRGAGQAGEGVVRHLDRLPFRDVAQVRDQLTGGDQAEVVLLAPREDRVRDLVVLGGGDMWTSSMIQILKRSRAGL